MSCGHVSEEIEEFRAGNHKYHELEVFPGLPLVLCEFCQVDFSSYDPTYFGLPRDRTSDLRRMNMITEDHTKETRSDLVCTKCNHPLPFLEFVAQARGQHRA